jgi:hypothetical protein
LKTLTPREEKIIKIRFGLEGGSQHTLEEVGQAFALTRERIRQIEAKALRKLATPRARANSASSPPAARENNTRPPLRPKLEKGSRARGELGTTDRGSGPNDQAPVSNQILWYGQMVDKEGF